MPLNYDLMIKISHWSILHSFFCWGWLARYYSSSWRRSTS